MIKRDHLKKAINARVRELRVRWQMFFLPVAIIYGLSVWHFFSINPSVKTEMIPFVRNIDTVGFVIAIVLAVLVFQIKRRYFSLRFVRHFMEEIFRKNASTSDEDAVKKMFRVWQGKFMTVWGLGALIVVVGVVSYWLTFSSEINFHIYFVIGAFSLFVNYPRQDLFADLPWQIAEARRDVQAGEISRET